MYYNETYETTQALFNVFGVIGFIEILIHRRLRREELSHSF